MRALTSHITEGCNNQPVVIARGVKGPGGAEIRYVVLLDTSENGKIELPFSYNSYAGVTNEALLAIVIDRLDGFQEGDFSCDENALALKYLDLALHYLKQRTRDRLSRGVEGKAEK